MMHLIQTIQIIINYLLTIFLYYHGNPVFFVLISLSNLVIFFINLKYITIFQIIISLLFCRIDLLIVSAAVYLELYFIEKQALQIKKMLDDLDAILIIDDDNISKIPAILCDKIVSISDEEGLLNKIYDKKRANLIIHTCGGDAESANRSANNIMSHGNVYCYVPEYAHSAGSLLALACNNIYMHRYASLSPVDTTIEHNNVMRSANCVTNDNEASQYVNHDKMLTEYLLKDRACDKLINIFASGTIPHNSSFNYDFLKKSGLKVSRRIPYNVMLFHVKYKEFYRNIKRFL